MAIIKKNVFNAEKIVFPGKTGKIKYWVSATDQQIEIKVYSNESVGTEENPATADVVMLWDIIKLSELQKKPGFVDQTLWTRVSRDVLPIQEDSEQSYVYSPLELHESALIDVFGETLITKPKTLTNPSSTHAASLYTIFVPDSSDFTSCVIRLMFDAKYEAGFEVEGPAASSFVDEHVKFEDLVSPITLSSTQTSVTPNSSISVTVNSDSFIDEVYLESVSGILNKTRVKLTNGQGKFSILTTDLEVGEEVRVKAGHKKWSGIASFSKEIS
jgi:hypothetical protein